MLEAKVPNKNADEQPKVTIIGIVTKRKKDLEDDSNKKQRNEEAEAIKDKVAACHSFKALANYVGTLNKIHGRTETFTGVFVAKLIRTPNINPNMITNTYNIRQQFTLITKHTEKISACNSIDELIGYLETDLPLIPTSAAKDGMLPAEKLISLLKKLSENKHLVKSIPSAYGLRENVTNLITTYVAKP